MSEQTRFQSQRFPASWSARFGWPVVGAAAFAVAACPGQVAAADLPSPAVEMRFSRNLQNTGTLGGEGRFVEYVAGQGPVFGVGVRGTGVDFTASSRGGGLDRSLAGGAVILSCPGLGRLEQLTLAAWVCPLGPNSPARLLFMDPCWDLWIGDNRVGFKVKHELQDSIFQVSKKAGALRDAQWNLVVVTYDRAAGLAQCFFADTATEPRLVATWENVPTADLADADLEIGNLTGIRPLRGGLDNVRIFGSVLSAEQVAALWRSDIQMPYNIKDGVARLPTPPSLFERSDVCFTSRSKHPNSAEMFQKFHANRLLWCYTAEREFTEQCRAAGAVSFQGAMNSIAGPTRPEAQALDFDGNPVVAPWMVAFNPKAPWYWGCDRRSAFLECSVARAKAALDTGADWMQFDDWSMTFHASQWGGACFCTDCMAGFRDDLKVHATPAQLAELGIQDVATFDYRQYLRDRHQIQDAAGYKAAKRSLPTTPFFEAFQRRSGRAFFQQLRERMNALAGRPVPFSVNTTLIGPQQDWNYLTDIVDFVQGETLEFALADLAVGAKTAEGLGRWHVFVPESLDVPALRGGIAASYALGQFMMVPWDMYMGSDEKGIQPRGWGKVEDYGDLYQFVRDQAALLNGYETVATVGLVLNLDHFDRARTRAVCQRLFDLQVPFAILPVGHDYYDAGLDAERLKTFGLLVTLNDREDFADADWAALEAAAAEVAFVPASQATAEALAAYARFEFWGPRGVYLVPRTTRDPNRRTLVCHVLNQVEGGRELKWTSFLVRKKLFLGEKLASVTWHVPGQAPQPLEFESMADGVRVIMPKLPFWGIAELRFE
ncbi:MAG: hypothetical protein A3K19_13295 [Lentisphaerae bacterium RIFOXYB12_FULL_65_16]|nr:MAG: hypothetical protein A3K18_01220 [Lentisphaerae bacterium RIFOXYA12_64_32]OGV90264.1 MAG: hypothetical protein A3K19_13295 [Lentisphaerae bacterium RIFOXYB12_FULL_65_16]